MPAGFAISGVSAHAWSHLQGCRVSLDVQLSVEIMDPHLYTTRTGGPFGGE